MTKQKQRFAAWITAAVTGLFCLLPGIPARAAQIAAVQGEGTPSNNLSAHNYDVWSDNVRSYLHETENGLERVEAIDGRVVVEQVTADGKNLLDMREIAFPLPLFGGCYFGKTYNYLAFAQKNMEEDDHKEVLRIQRYDKNWHLIDHGSVYGGTTSTPFVAGTLQMLEAAGKLYVYSCHEMYRYVDGYIHQSNMTFLFHAQTMRLEQQVCDFSPPEEGCYPHSLNQLIQSDGTDLYRVDHLEFERGVWITQSEAGGDLRVVTRLNTMPVPGDWDTMVAKYKTNLTGVSVGGFELSDTSCLIAGNAVDLNEASYDPLGQRNIFITVADKSLRRSYTRWLTAYNPQENLMPLTPQLVKVDGQQFWVLWEEMQKYNRESVVTKAMLIDDEGEQMSEIIELPVRLSDCQPFVGKDGKLHWYTTSHSAPVYYAVDPLKMEAAAPHPTCVGDITGDTGIDARDAAWILRYAVNGGVLTMEQEIAADVNQDGCVDAKDAACILRYAVASAFNSELDLSEFIH